MPFAEVDCGDRNMLGALIWIMLFQVIGEFAVRLFGLPLSAPVAGMLLLFGSLIARGEVAEELRTTSTKLLQYLTLVLVPPTVGIMNHFTRIYEEWLPILLACIGGAAATMTVTALTLRLLLARSADSLDA
jgi:holin-like protein